MSLMFLLLACGTPAEPVVEAPPADAHHHAEAPSADAHHHAEAPDPGSHKVGTMHHRFDDAAKWAEVFDNPERDAWQKPGELVAALALTPGQAVADIGAGTGYFEPHLARAVGEQGAVVGIDIEPNLIAHMTDRFQSAGLSQVSARLGQPDDPGLAEAEFDVVLLVDTYHHISERPAYFAKVAQGLRDGGRLVVVDFKKDEDLPVGPPPEHRLSVDQVTQELTDAGWTAAGSLDVLPYQYVLVFTAGL